MKDLTAIEARKITFEHSKRMTYIYGQIEHSAKQGFSEVAISTDKASKPEIEVLAGKGFQAGYETSEVDGGQFVLIKW